MDYGGVVSPQKSSAMTHTPKTQARSLFVAILFRILGRLGDFEILAVKANLVTAQQ